MAVESGLIDRLNFLSPDGKSLYGWLSSMGMSHGVVDGLKKGSILSGDKLALLFRVHRISSSWLLTEQGSPYVVDHYPTTNLLREAVENRLKDEPETTLTLVESGDEPKALVLAIAASVEVGTEKNRQTINYTAYTVLSGDIDKQSLENKINKTVSLPSRVANQLIAGDIGNILEILL